MAGKMVVYWRSYNVIIGEYQKLLWLSPCLFFLGPAMRSGCPPPPSRCHWHAGVWASLIYYASAPCIMPDVDAFFILWWAHGEPPMPLWLSAASPGKCGPPFESLVTLGQAMCLQISSFGLISPAGRWLLFVATQYITRALDLAIWELNRYLFWKFVFVTVVL